MDKLSTLKTHHLDLHFHSLELINELFCRFSISWFIFVKLYTPERLEYPASDQPVVLLGLGS
jgi:hypothetical protein